MDKNARYSLTALGILAVAASIFGILSLTTKVQISASTNVAQVVVDRSVPLKMGANNLRNGPKKITLQSKVIAVNDNLISVEDAMQREIIGSLTYSKNVLGENTNQIPPDTQFSVPLQDSSRVVQFLSEEIE